MSSPHDMTSVDAVKLYGSIENPNPAILGALITAVSRAVLSYTGRDSILSRAYDEFYDGRGSSTLILRHYPVTSVSLLSLYGQAIPQGSNVNNTTLNVLNPFQSGFLFTPWGGEPPGNLGKLDLLYGIFQRDKQNIEVKYQAGYLATDPAIAPSNNQIKPLQLQGRFADDQGVINTVTGLAMTAVSSSSAPGAGQYKPPDRSGTPEAYTFNAADAASPMIVSYSFTPSDLEQAVIMQVAELLAYRGHIGMQSKTLGGQETSSFLIKDMIPAVKMMIAPYRNVAKSLIR